MREILETCVELDKRAYDLYRGLSEDCPDPELSLVFGNMAIEERTHIDWWSDLLVAWEGGLLPDIADEHDLLARLNEVRNAVDSIESKQPDDLCGDDMLDLAAQYEFYLLDPLFGELVDLIEPGNKSEIREAYSRHVLRIVEAIEKHYTRPGLARFLASVLKRGYRDQQRLAALAVRDQLTGLFNRRGLVGHLNQWLSWSARYGRPVGVVLIDLDRFKEINDRFGHATGDRVLQSVGQALRQTVRASDVVGRFGGDEFLVLAPEGDRDMLQQLMDRLVAAVDALDLTVADQKVRVSVSVGGAWMAGGLEMAPETFVGMADSSMYDAKGAGRGQAGHVAEPSVAG